MLKKVLIGITAVVFVILVAGYYLMNTSGGTGSEEVVKTKQVATCVSFLVGANAEIDCSGDYNGKTTMVELYRKGWTFNGDISGTNKLMLVFEK